MCVSAEASFGVGAALVSAGAYCLDRAIRLDRRYLALAAIPICFAAQQCAEGFVWLDLAGRGVEPGNPAVRTYLFFALAFWPFWVSVCVAGFDRRRLPWLLATAAVGLLVGCALFAPLVVTNDRDLVVSVVNHSIRYDLERLPVLRVIPDPVMRAVYLATVVVPLFLGGSRGLRVLGAVVLVSALLSRLLVDHAFVSIWCFISAVATAGLVFFFRTLGRTAS